MATQLEQLEIINLAVNIFQNVGIKRYIGDINALRHEDIYFEIYKIIFPYSMINIFKISESSLTAGQKIQKIIEQISSIIKLDLYHISGEAIAEGNMAHITNWLQLLEALSNNIIVNSAGYRSGGSAPDRERYFEQQFEEDDYHTVIGMEREFYKPVYSDEYDEDSENAYENQMEYDRYGHLKQHKSDYEFQKDRNKESIDFSNDEPETKKQARNEKKNREGEKTRMREKEEESKERQNEHKQEFDEEDFLKPVSKKKKNGKKEKSGSKKKVTFKIDNVRASPKNPKQFRNKKITGSGLRSTAGTATEPRARVKVQNVSYGQVYEYPSSDKKLLKRKSQYIRKMHILMEEKERKKIEDENIRFEQWRLMTNQRSIRDQMRIQQEGRQREELINLKNEELTQIFDSLSGEYIAYQQINKIFKQNRRKERQIAQYLERKKCKEVEELMDMSFAADVQNMVLSSLAE